MDRDFVNENCVGVAVDEENDCASGNTFGGGVVAGSKVAREFWPRKPFLRGVLKIDGKGSMSDESGARAPE